MEAAKHADVIVSMDADLQDDIHAVDRMLDAYQAGAEVVYGVRSARKTDTTFQARYGGRILPLYAGHGCGHCI